MRGPHQDGMRDNSSWASVGQLHICGSCITYPSLRVRGSRFATRSHFRSPSQPSRRRACWACDCLSRSRARQCWQTTGTGDSIYAYLTGHRDRIGGLHLDPTRLILNPGATAVPPSSSHPDCIVPKPRNKTQNTTHRLGHRDGCEERGCCDSLHGEESGACKERTSSLKSTTTTAGEKKGMSGPGPSSGSGGTCAASPGQHVQTNVWLGALGQDRP